jgi:hypothetical protein
VRTVGHFLCVAFGFVVWCVGSWLYASAAGFAVLAEKCKPNSTHNNCWSFALDRWARLGGYLLVREADGQRFLGFMMVPHVAWVKHLGHDIDLEHFAPIRRKRGWWMPWHVIYYRGRVSHGERNHDIKD